MTVITTVMVEAVVGKDMDNHGTMHGDDDGDEEEDDDDDDDDDDVMMMM